MNITPKSLAYLRSKMSQVCMYKPDEVAKLADSYYAKYNKAYFDNEDAPDEIPEKDTLNLLAYAFAANVVRKRIVNIHYSRLSLNPEIPSNLYNKLIIRLANDSLKELYALGEGFFDDETKESAEIAQFDKLILGEDDLALNEIENEVFTELNIPVKTKALAKEEPKLTEIKEETKDKIKEEPKTSSEGLTDYEKSLLINLGAEEKEVPVKKEPPKVKRHEEPDLIQIASSDMDIDIKPIRQNQGSGVVFDANVMGDILTQRHFERFAYGINRENVIGAGDGGLASMLFYNDMNRRFNAIKREESTQPHGDSAFTWGRGVNDLTGDKARAMEKMDMYMGLEMRSRQRTWGQVLRRPLATYKEWKLRNKLKDELKKSYNLTDANLNQVKALSERNRLPAGFRGFGSYVGAPVKAAKAPAKRRGEPKYDVLIKDEDMKVNDFIDLAKDVDANVIAINRNLHKVNEGKVVNKEKEIR